METAILWHDSPFRFMARPLMERAVMIAHYRERSLRRAMVDKVQSDISEKKSKVNNDTGTDPHAPFFGGL